MSDKFGSVRMVYTWKARRLFSGVVWLTSYFAVTMIVVPTGDDKGAIWIVTDGESKKVGRGTSADDAKINAEDEVRAHWGETYGWDDFSGTGYTP